MTNQKFNKEEMYNALNQHGMPAFEAFDKIQRELEEDGLMNRDLGSYTAIQMLPEADLLIHQSNGKNLVNQNEYQKTTSIHNNLIKTIADFLHVPDVDRAFGSSTTGSSEAIFLAILAAKWQWKNKNTGGKPNLVFCSNAHLSWYKFARFLDVEIREVELEAPNKYPIKEVLNSINEDTLLVVTILGCTYLGTCDPIQLLNDEMEKLNAENNWDIGIHVDAAIGGFIVPFQPHVSDKWDFELSLVRSINLSGHKYGLVYPGLGWILFRDHAYFQAELRSRSNYLNGFSESFTVNFSRSSSLVIAQYFNFLHYGIQGYQKIIEKCMHNAYLLRAQLEGSELFEIISTDQLPVVVFTFKKKPAFTAAAFTALLRKRKWMLPFYQLSGKINTTVMRIVVRNDITEPLISVLAKDLVDTYYELDTP